MRLAMFNDHSKLKLLSFADTRFASTIVMLKRFKQIKQGLKQMVISERWDMYKDDDVEKARAVKEKILNEYFWVDIDYILSFTAPIYEILWMADTDTPCLHLVYEWWDSMIEKVKIAKFRKERRQLDDKSRFFDVVYGILVERWTKSSTPLHCLAHSLNPRNKSIERYFTNDIERRKVNEEYAAFTSCHGHFSGHNSISDRVFMSPEERLVFVHNNLRLLSKKSPSYNKGVSQLWDVGGDGFDSMDMEDAGLLEIANLSLDEPQLEVVLFGHVDNVMNEVI
ncbi:hypothetical protein Ddye_004267 [Dipteronia dyeriana]|uniref:Uncharacterized protein n=1 Tax=Dipteronia dyeriana TaxID=168575 RepID=A0AAD9XVE9_9ROSI|nr:hypothetical protein Ddye_004267 [Dipteronia dyeriana]